MHKCRWAIGGVLALLLLWPGPRRSAADDKAAADEKAAAAAEATFKMQEVSIFDLNDKEAGQLLRYAGRLGAQCGATPSPGVKAYPKLNSKQPLYGTIVLGRDPAEPASSGIKFHFVLDESAAEAKAEEKPAEKPAEKSDAKDAPASKSTAPAASRQYDRLYFDLNHDLDLTNDPAVALMKAPPATLARSGFHQENSRVFDYLAVPLGDDPKVKSPPLKILPVLTVAPGFNFMTFLSGSARRGEIRVGSRAYRAILAPPGGMSGRFDKPYTPLVLTPADGSKRQRPYWGLDTLGALREVEGEFYAFSATPGGDQLAVQPYRGDCGVFEVTAGGRDIQKLGAVGILRSKDAMMPLGSMAYPIPEEKRSKYKVPVGDYQPMLLYVDYGTLAVGLRQVPAAATGGLLKQPAYPIAIRKDKPYLLDFSTKPVINVVAPAKEKTFKPGDTIRLATLLADPERGMFIAALEDTTKKVGEIQWTDEDGKQVAVPRYALLEPTVVITDSSDKKVAEGKMPFG